VGFAFQDILGNLLAGILLLFRQPFVGGDQIRVDDVEGTVERITIRETVLTTFDGERILVPNAEVYKGVVLIHTAHRVRRSSFVVGVAYDADLEHVRSTARAAVGNVEGVFSDPAPEALVVELRGTTVDLEVRFFCGSREQERRLVLDRALAAVTCAFVDAGIEMPAQVVALQPTSSFSAALQDDRVRFRRGNGTEDGAEA
jgi:small-conductance mechanosensitive channel